MSKVPPKRALPSKEATLFKELLTLYETRQLKKGLKTADQILKKFPEHGETLSMKGLVLTHMGRRDEGIEMVKKGIRFDLTSHIVWHVFGLIQKGEKNYEEALKSYTQALKFDKENLNILRDAAQLQSHLRLYDALVETRHKLLKMRPMVRQNWIALAVAHQLNGDLEEAKKVLENYETTLKNIPDYDVEHSEVLLYHVRLLEDLERWSEALALLDTSAKERAIVDKTSIMELRARLTSKLGSEDAEHSWRVLIEHNSECYDYYHGYLSNLGINTTTHPSQALKILHEFIVQLPRANTPKRLFLTIAPASFAGEESVPSFADQARAYLTTGLTKGIPSLFADIKSMYEDKEKLGVIQAIVEQIQKDHTPASTPSSSFEPTTYLWTLYFLAQHYSYLSQHSKALSLLDTALAHTPTLPELYTFRARVLKRAGDPIRAAAVMEEARAMDGQDRFLNTKSGKYMLRAEQQEEAEKIFGLFTKKDAPSPGADLQDMQSLLYLSEQADSQLQSGKLHMALKKYMAIQNTFKEYEDDQYDFHGYAIRKFNLNIYLNLMKWEDRLWAHPVYIKAATAAGRIFVKVHDDPKLKSPSGSGKLSDAELKAKKKAKKAAAAQKVQDDGKKSTATSTNEDKGLEPPTPKDEDPEGLKLLACDDPLERAAKLLQPILELEVDNVDVWVVAYDVAVRRNKLLQAIRALNRARKLSPEHPHVHERIVHARKLATSLSSQSSSSSSTASPTDSIPLFISEMNKIVPSDMSLTNYNSQYLQQHSGSAEAILSVSKVSARTLEAPVKEVEDLVFMVLGENVSAGIKTLLDGLSFLECIKSARVEEFRKVCETKFELSTVFKTKEERAKLAKDAFASANGVVAGNGSAEPDGDSP